MINRLQSGQIITPCYGVILSDPSQFMRPYMVSFLMVSVPLDQSKKPRPLWSQIIKKIPRPSALGGGAP